MDDLLDLNFAAPAGNAKSLAGGVAPKPPSFDFLNNATTGRTGTPISYGLPSAGAIKPVHNLYPSASSLSNGGHVSGLPSRVATPLARPSSSNSGIINSSSKEDAFSSLYSSSSTPASSALDDGLTLVERKQKLEAERKEKEKRDRDAFNFDSWSQGGTGSSAPGNFLHPTPSAQPRRMDATTVPPIKATPARPHSAAPLNATQATSSWDFDNLLAAPAPFPPTKASTRGPSPAPEPILDPWDMAMLDKPLPANIATTPSFSVVPQNQDVSDGDEDVLGLLAEPVKHPRHTPRESSATVSILQVRSSSGFAI
jgi:hypothetical protein